MQQESTCSKLSEGGGRESEKVYILYTLHTVDSCEWAIILSVNFSKVLHGLWLMQNFALW